MHVFLTLIGAVVEDVECVHCLFSSLLATEDQVDPLMEVIGHMLTFLEFNIQVDVVLNSYHVTGEVDLTYLRRCRHSQTAGVTGQPAAAGQQQFLPEVCAVCSVSLYTNEMGAIGGHFGAFYKLFFLPFVTPPAHTLLRPLLSPTSSDETLERSQNSPPKRVLMG